MIWIKYILIIVISTIFQLGLVEQGINSLYYLNLPLLVVIFYNWHSPKVSSISFAVAMAWGLSYFDALPFGVTIALFVIISLFVQRLSVTLLTNRTYGSLTLAGLLGVAVNYILLSIISFLQIGITFDFFKEYALSYTSIATQLLLSALLLILFKLLIFRHETIKA